MAKALLGHVGPVTDLRLVAEVRRLRTRVAELEEELARLRDAHDVFEAAVVVVDGVPPQTADLREPVLT